MMPKKRNHTPADIALWDEFVKGVKRCSETNIADTKSEREFIIEHRSYAVDIKHKTKTNHKHISLGDTTDIDSSLIKKMDRGLMHIDAKLDLHGRTIDEAFLDVIEFVFRNYSNGLRLLLIVTGKGKNSQNSSTTLQKELPKWLNSNKIANCILRAAHAHQKHGGNGAFYVLLKRRR